MNRKATTRPWGRWTAVAALCCAASTLSATAATPATPITEIPLLTQKSAASSTTTARLIVKYRDGATGIATGAQPRLAALQAVASRHGVQLSYVRSTGVGGNVLRMDRSLSVAQVKAIARDIEASVPDVAYAEPDEPLQSQSIPNDGRVDDFYIGTHSDLHLTKAWAQSTGAGVTVGVIDTGYLQWEDLMPNIVGGYDFQYDYADGDVGDGVGVPDGRDANAVAHDLDSHGSSVGSIIAAAGNGIGVAGIAFDAKLLMARARTMLDIADAIVWAAGGKVEGVPLNPRPARVINISKSSPTSHSCNRGSEKDAIDFALSRGVVVVMSAGNRNNDVPGLQAHNCMGTITVAASGAEGGKANYSSFGSQVAIAAPAGDMPGAGQLHAATLGPYRNEGIRGKFWGTSAASPVVAGIAALMLSKRPDLTPAEVRTLLQKSAVPFQQPCHGCGPGIVNAANAVAAAMSYKRSIGEEAAVDEWEMRNPKNIQNDSGSFAQWVADLPSKVRGTISSGSDVDFYRVELPAGHTLTAALGNATAGHELRLYQRTLTFDGDGFLKEATSSGYGDSKGTLTPGRLVWSRGVVERIPDASNAFYGIELLSTFYVEVRGKNGAMGPYELSLKVTDKPEADATEILEVDANNTLATAQAVAPETKVINATMGSTKDSDFYKFVLPPGKTVNWKMEPNVQMSYSKASDYDLYLYDDAGNLVNSSTNGRNMKELLSASNFSTVNERVLRLEVRYKAGLTGADGDYKLHMFWY